jgi:hypothetical protein
MNSTTLIIIAVAALLTVVVALILRRVSWGSSPGYTKLPPRPSAPPDGSPAGARRALDPNVERELQALVASQQTITAVKRVRELTGMGLKEAKDYVESLE